MPEQKRLSLRDIVHILGSKHQLFLLGSGIIKECLEDVLTKKDFPLECKEEIKKAIGDLGKIEKASREADKLLDKIKEIVYERLNPDEIKLKAE